MSIHRLSRNAVASMILAIGSTFLLIDLYRLLFRQLGPEQIGIWSLVVASTAAGRLGEVGIGSAVTKFVAGDLGAGLPERAAATLGMCFATVAVLMATFCLLLWPILDFSLSLLITQPASLLAARALLPLALGALWLGSVAQVALCALDAMQRTELKAFVTLGASCFQVALAHIFVPTSGLMSLGVIQVVHAGVSALASIGLIAYTLGVAPAAWFSVNRDRLVLMLRYGAAAQVGSVGQLLFEPSTKALLALFGGLSLTAYFETANRAVAQCRSLIVAAYQTLIPYIAHRAGHSDLTPAQISTTYRSVHAILILISFPYFGILATSLPLVFGLWLGRDESQFVAIGLACALGWGINTLMVSSYTIYLAIGQLRWTLWTQLAIGTLNVLLATLGGWAFGGNGVVPGSMLALAVGSSVVTAAFHRQFGLHCREFFPKASATIVGASVIGPCMLLAMQLWPGSHMTDRWLIFAGLLSQTLVCAVLVWRHPVIAALIARLRTPNIDGARAGLA